MATLIGITGGIGCGKSVVSQICRSLGFVVYDCDAEAKCLMDNSDYIKHRLCNIVGVECVDEQGNINRSYLASRLFEDDDVRNSVNALVHQCVREDIRQCVETANSDRPLFIESAIMHTSRLDRMMQQIWLVESPEQLRIERVMRRNNFSREQVCNRIRVQQYEYEHLSCPLIHTLHNDEKHSLLLQVNNLLSRQ